MAFFDDAAVEDMAEAHATKLIKLEESEARQVLKSYRRVRQELQDRLSTLDEGTFSAQKARSTLAQIDMAIKSMGTSLLDDMVSAGENFAGVGAENLLAELRKWDRKFAGAVTPINLDINRVASDTSELLFNKYESSIDSYSESVRSKLAFHITNGVIAELDTGTMINRIGKTFLGEEWVLARLVRTELHGVYNVGKIEGMKDLAAGDVPDLKKTLWHKMDARTGEDSKRLNARNPIVPVDEEFVEDSTGKVVRYMAPPNRPNDRAVLIPFRDSWAEEQNWLVKQVKDKALRTVVGMVVPDVFEEVADILE